MSQYQKSKTNLDFTESRGSEWQWHQLGRVQVCTSLQTDNHTSTPPLSFFYGPDALCAALLVPGIELKTFSYSMSTDTGKQTAGVVRRCKLQCACCSGAGRHELAAALTP